MRESERFLCSYQQFDSSLRSQQLPGWFSQRVLHEEIGEPPTIRDSADIYKPESMHEVAAWDVCRRGPLICLREA